MALCLALAHLGTSALSKARPDLAVRTAALAAASLAPSTRRVYSTGQRKYLKFALDHNFIPFPVVDESVAFWLAELSESVSPRTLRIYLASVLKLATELGCPTSFDSHSFVSRVLKGATLIFGSTNREPRRPVTMALLRRFKPLLDLRRHDDRMIWAAFTIAVFGLFRSGEIALPPAVKTTDSRCLRRSAVSFDWIEGRRTIKLVLRASKTDSARRGVTIRIGPTGREVCPVEALSVYLQSRDSLLFAGADSPLFVFSDGQVLTQKSLTFLLHTLLRSVGMSTEGFSGHSFRVGGASELAAAGVPAHIIQKAGRWASNTFLEYLRFTPREETSWAASMAARAARSR